MDRPVTPVVGGPLVHLARREHAERQRRLEALPGTVRHQVLGLADCPLDGVGGEQRYKCRESSGQQEVICV